MSILLQYLAWRVLTGLHRTVRMSFMLVGHTKFAPDWCFGLFKQRYRRTFVSSLDDVVDVVNTSADVNVAQLVGTQSGEPVVPVYNWVSYLGVHFRSIPHLKQYQHFIFSATHPGVVTLKMHSNSSEETFTMLDSGSWSPVASELPPLIKSSGLPLERQWYLHKQIRPYCREGTEDLTCPKPSLDTTTNTNTTTNKTGGAPAPPAKRRKCGKCGEIGHTRRSCKED